MQATEKKESNTLSHLLENLKQAMGPQLKQKNRLDTLIVEAKKGFKSATAYADFQARFFDIELDLSGSTAAERYSQIFEMFSEKDPFVQQGREEKDASESDLESALRESREMEESRKREEGEILEKVNLVLSDLTSIDKEISTIVQEGKAIAEKNMGRYLALLAKKETAEAMGVDLLQVLLIDLGNKGKSYEDAMRALFAALGEAVPLPIKEAGYTGIEDVTLIRAEALAEAHKIQAEALAEEHKKSAWRNLGVAPELVAALKKEMRPADLKVVETELLALLPAMQQMADREEYSARLEKVELEGQSIYLLELPLIRLARRGHAEAVKAFIDQDFVPVDLVSDAFYAELEARTGTVAYFTEKGAGRFALFESSSQLEGAGGAVLARTSPPL